MPPIDADPDRPADLETLVRGRLRSLRHSMGWSLDELAARSHLSASTISRIETGKRAIGLDVLVALARALQVDLDALLGEPDDEDVVIRPTAADLPGGWTTWMLSRPTAASIAMKVRIDTAGLPDELEVHPGRDWFFVVEGRVLLALGDRQVMVEAGEAAEFDTMTPHGLCTPDGPAEVIMLFDRDGHRAHVHSDAT